MKPLEYCGLGVLTQHRAPAHTRYVRPHQPPRLTPRDCQLLDLLSEGWLLKEIGPEMLITEGTAKMRLSNLRRKFDARTTMELMSWYSTLKLLVAQMKLVILVLVAVVASAQSPGVTDTQFSPQGFAIGPYQEYIAVICQPSEQALAVNSGQVVNAARAHGISLVAYERVRQAENATSRVTAWTWARRGVQAGAAAFLVADQAGLWKIGSDEHPARWKVVVPAVGIVLPQVVSWVTDNAPASEMAPESQRLPTFFQVPGRSGASPGCVQYTVYGLAVP